MALLDLSEVAFVNICRKKDKKKAKKKDKSGCDFFVILLVNLVNRISVRYEQSTFSRR
jgi:hypothetical protein